MPRTTAWTVGTSSEFKYCFVVAEARVRGLELVHCVCSCGCRVHLGIDSVSHKKDGICLMCREGSHRAKRGCDEVG